jgi:hypothetical protein
MQQIVMIYHNRALSRISVCGSARHLQSTQPAAGLLCNTGFRHRIRQSDLWPGDNARISPTPNAFRWLQEIFNAAGVEAPGMQVPGKLADITKSGGYAG